MVLFQIEGDRGKGVLSSHTGIKHYLTQLSNLQPALEINVEVHYAVRFCVKLWENADETYEMLQTGHGLTRIG